MSIFFYEIMSNTFDETDLKNFNDFRTLYPGSKRGNETEFNYFIKKTKDWKAILPNLKSFLANQEKIRKIKSDKGEWVKQYQNLKTYICNRSWEENNTDNQQVIQEKTAKPQQKSHEQKHQEMLENRRRINETLKIEGHEPIFTNEQLNEPVK